MKKKKSGAMLKVGIVFGGGYLFAILLVILLCGLGGSGGVGGLPIVVTEEQAYDYQYVCSEVGVPWDMALLADIMLADQNGQTDLENLNPIYTALQFCVLKETRHERELVLTDDLETGEMIYEPIWHHKGDYFYSGLNEIIDYMNIDASWLADKEMSEVIERIKEVCEEKETEDRSYKVSISVNEGLDAVLSDVIGLSPERCKDVKSLYEIQYMTQLYGYIYDFGEVVLPELVVGEVTRNELAHVAVSLIGHPYLLGGKSPHMGSPQSPLDCSGFVDWVYIQCFGTGVSGGGVPEGVAMSGTAMQWYASAPIEENELKVGDLAFLHNPENLAPGQINHVGIYIGSVGGTKYFIHCAGKSYGTEALPNGRVGISKRTGGANSYNCVTGGSFEPAMKACNFKYFRRPNFSFLGD